jgi:hypothetical protein
MKKVRAGVLRIRRRVEQEMLWVALVKVKREMKERWARRTQNESAIS